MVRIAGGSIWTNKSGPEDPLAYWQQWVVPHEPGPPHQEALLQARYVSPPQFHPLLVPVIHSPHWLGDLDPQGSTGTIG